MKLSDIILIVSEYLSGEIPEPDLSAKYIVSEVLGVKIPELVFMGDREISDYTFKKILKLAKRRAKNEPLQYIFGKAYFRNLSLKVGNGVLVPRPETETLVEIALRETPANASICEIGCGSGAISLAFASERPDSKVFASEISSSAIKYARKNKKGLLIKNAFFYNGDLFAPFSGKKFHAILANLPYVTSAEMKKLPREISDHEPHLALDGGKGGIDIVKRFFVEAPKYAIENAFIIAEVSPPQTTKLKKFLAKDIAYSNLHILKDLCGRKRFITARLNQSN
ncbi:MAG TPA: peptide chain release factor N(5)-glutamine methyltransferase [Victivallales bacterium]|nr:peptide chain release factor N(5)-glutamine methyltransferase [Victivallales bacterium]